LDAREKFVQWNFKNALIKTWFFGPMAELIIGNNIRWDQALLKQIQHYKPDGIVPWLVDKNFQEIALAVTLDPSGKVTSTNKGTVYKIVPYDWTP